MRDAMNSSASNSEKGVVNVSVIQTLLIAVLVVALGAMAFIQVGLRHDQERNTKTLSDLLERQQSRIDAIESRTASIEQDTSTLHSETQKANTGLKDTQNRLTQTRNVALTQIQKEHELTAQQLTDMAEKSDSRFGSISGDVTAVRGNLDETKASLEGVNSKLEHAVGDLGVQSGLVARNHDELVDLKRRGERDYQEFDLKRNNKEFTRVSDLGLQLTKADPRNQKYTVAVMVADKRLEKKDKTALEPLQLYMPGGHKLVEIVVWDVNKDRVVGYVSSPKL